MSVQRRVQKLSENAQRTRTHTGGLVGRAPQQELKQHRGRGVGVDALVGWVLLSLLAGSSAVIVVKISITVTVLVVVGGSSVAHTAASAASRACGGAIGSWATAARG